MLYCAATSREMLKILKACYRLKALPRAPDTIHALSCNRLEADVEPGSVSFEFYAVAVHQQWVKQFINEYFEHFRTLLEELIQQGIDNGEFRHVNVRNAAISFASLYEGLTLHWLMDPQTVQWEILSENSIPMLLDGLKVRP